MPYQDVTHGLLIFSENFLLMANMTLGQLKVHGHEHLRPLIFHNLYQLKESLAGSCACSRASDAQREKEI